MTRTREQIERAAADRRRIGLALIDRAHADAEIESAVVAARRNGAVVDAHRWSTS